MLCPDGQLLLGVRQRQVRDRPFLSGCRFESNPGLFMPDASTGLIALWEFFFFTTSGRRDSNPRPVQRLFEGSKGLY